MTFDNANCGSCHFLEGVVEQPLTFALNPESVGAESSPPSSVVGGGGGVTALLLDCRRLWMQQTPGGGFCGMRQPEPQPPPPVSSEVAYRQWLTDRCRGYFQPYASSGGMPCRQFLERFIGRDLRRSAKLAKLLRRAEANREGVIDWAEFYAGMTYRQLGEVRPARRLLNGLVKTADPGAKEVDVRLRADAAARGEPIPEDAYIELYRCRPPPVFVPLLLLAMLIVFCVSAVQLNAGPDWNRVGWATGVPYSSPLAFCPNRRHEVWRFVSHALLHAGWYHLVFSCATLLLLGLPLQLAHSALRVAAIYLGGVLLGALLSSVADPGAMLIGAAGGSCALIGAHIGLTIIHWRQLRVEWRPLTTGAKLAPRVASAAMTSSLRLMVIVALAYADFGVAAFQRHRPWWSSRTPPQSPPPLSYLAHPAGLAWGCLIGAQLLRVSAPTSAPTSAKGCSARCQRRFFRVSLAAFAGFVLFAVLWNLIYDAPRAEGGAAGGLSCGFSGGRGAGSVRL